MSQRFGGSHSPAYTTRLLPHRWDGFAEQSYSPAFTRVNNPFTGVNAGLYGSILAPSQTFIVARASSPCSSASAKNNLVFPRFPEFKNRQHGPEARATTRFENEPVIRRSCRRDKTPVPAVVRRTFPANHPVRSAIFRSGFPDRSVF